MVIATFEENAGAGGGMRRVSDDPEERTGPLSIVTVSHGWFATRIDLTSTDGGWAGTKYHAHPSAVILGIVVAAASIALVAKVIL